MVLAHFASSGTGVVNLPPWALAYGVFSILVITALWSRSHFVATARPAPPAPASADRRPWPLTVAQVLGALALLILLVVAGTGQVQIGQNVAPIAIVGVYWTLGGWVSLVVGRAWGPTDPFLLAARLGARRRSARPPRLVLPWWSGTVVLATFVVVWVAWPAGDQPRNLAVWIGCYLVAMSVVGWRGGSSAVARANSLPKVLDFAATIVPRRATRADADPPEERRATGLLAALVIGAVTVDRLSASTWWLAHVGDRGTLALTLVASVLIVAATAAVAGLWRLVDRHVERARGEHTTWPLATSLAPIAVAVLMAHELHPALIQVQNLAILASDPFARGWDLFGTHFWEISQQPLSPLVSGVTQALIIVAGHVAALVQTGRAATRVATDDSSGIRFRHRAWMAALPAMALVTVGGVVWTLVLLGV